ncbi:hypothetical protein BGZ63DRAFT_403688 [Mariannaea sp. PMI_226]|nr:hypothetical protein BGZ63DRAFT_403688 [Mariannaea sp. PMI_226]
MAGDNDLASAGQLHLAPEGDSNTASRALPRVISKPDSQHSGSSRESSSISELPRVTKFSKTHVAKRGHSRLRMPWLSQRAPLKHQTKTSSPNGGSNNRKAHKPQIDSCSPTTREPQRQALPIDPEPGHLPIDTDLDSVEGAQLPATTEIENCKSLEDLSAAPCSNPFKATTDSSKDTSIRPSWSPERRGGGLESIDSSKTSPFSVQRASGIRHDSYEASECIIAVAEVNLAINNSSSDPSISPSIHVDTSRHPIVGHGLPQDSEHPRRTIRPSASSDSGRAADIDSNTEDEDFRPFAWTRPKKLQALENSSESGDEDSIWVSPAADPGGEITPSNLKQTDAAGSFQENHAVQRCSEENGSKNDTTPVVPLHIVLATQRKAQFDSDAFDDMIYHRSKVQLPKGDSVTTHLLKKKSCPEKSERLFLHINPAIHRPHRQSTSWYQRKANEIKARGRRKEWYGKYHERQRFLRAQEAAREVERHQAVITGEIYPRRDPQPRVHARIRFLADLDDEDLPDEVKSNPPWLEALSWFRKTEDEKRKRQEKRRREAKKQGIEQVHRPGPKNPRERYLQAATEEVERFYKAHF